MLPDFPCFNRSKDSYLIKTEEIKWDGPFSLPKYHHINKLNVIPDISGVYIFTFNYKDGYIVRLVGESNSFKRRMNQHIREYKKGNYTILDVKSAQKGIRKEIWHGWSHAKRNPDQFIENKDYIMDATEQELASYRLFVANIPDKRKSQRIEFAIMHNIYADTQPWSDLVDRGMFLTGRFNSEVPINTKNQCQHKLYGLADFLEI
jgi:hypothetical protein